MHCGIPRSCCFYLLQPQLQNAFSVCWSKTLIFQRDLPSYLLYMMKKVTECVQDYRKKIKAYYFLWHIFGNLTASSRSSVFISTHACVKMLYFNLHYTDNLKVSFFFFLIFNFAAFIVYKNLPKIVSWKVFQLKKRLRNK